MEGSKYVLGKNHTMCDTDGAVGKLKQVDSPVTSAQINFLLWCLAVRTMPVLCYHSDKHSTSPLTCRHLWNKQNIVSEGWLGSFAGLSAVPQSAASWSS